MSPDRKAVAELLVDAVARMTESQLRTIMFANSPEKLRAALIRALEGDAA